MRFPAPVGAVLAGAASAAATDLTIAQLGVDDPRTWTRAEWAADAVPHLARIDEVPENAPAAVEAGQLGHADFRPALNDFYLSNPIARSSALMGQLSAMAAERSAPAIAAE